MIPLRALVVVACLVAVAPSVALAQQPQGRAVAKLDPSELAAVGLNPVISHVVSGGRWTARGKTGSYRVVEVSQGWDIIRRRVFVQWLWDDDNDDRPDGPRTIIAAWRELGSLAIGWFSLTDPQLSWQKGRWEVSVKAASAPAEQPSETLSFALGGPGEVRILDDR